MAVFGLHAQDVLRFIYCSDLHYGIRREFRGGEVDAVRACRRMAVWKRENFMGRRTLSSVREI